MESVQRSRVFQKLVLPIGKKYWKRNITQIKMVNKRLVWSSLNEIFRLFYKTDTRTRALLQQVRLYRRSLLSGNRENGQDSSATPPSLLCFAREMMEDKHCVQLNSKPTLHHFIGLQILFPIMPRKCIRP